MKKAGDVSVYVPALLTALLIQVNGSILFVYRASMNYISLKIPLL